MPRGQSHARSPAKPTNKLAGFEKPLPGVPPPRPRRSSSDRHRISSSYDAKPPTEEQVPRRAGMQYVRAEPFVRPEPGARTYSVDKHDVKIVPLHPMQSLKATPDGVQQKRDQIKRVPVSPAPFEREPARLQRKPVGQSSPMSTPQFSREAMPREPWASPQFSQTSSSRLSQTSGIEGLRSSYRADRMIRAGPGAIFPTSSDLTQHNADIESFFAQASRAKANTPTSMSKGSPGFPRYDDDHRSKSGCPRYSYDASRNASSEFSRPGSAMSGSSVGSAISKMTGGMSPSFLKRLHIPKRVSADKDKPTYETWRTSHPVRDASTTSRGASCAVDHAHERDRDMPQPKPVSPAAAPSEMRISDCTAKAEEEGLAERVTGEKDQRSGMKQAPTLPWLQAHIQHIKRGTNSPFPAPSGDSQPRDHKLWKRLARRPSADSDWSFKCAGPNETSLSRPSDADALEDYTSQGEAPSIRLSPSLDSLSTRHSWNIAIADGLDRHNEETAGTMKQQFQLTVPNGLCRNCFGNVSDVRDFLCSSCKASETPWTEPHRFPYHNVPPMRKPRPASSIYMTSACPSRDSLWRGQEHQAYNGYSVAGNPFENLADDAPSVSDIRQHIQVPESFGGQIGDGEIAEEKPYWDALWRHSRSPDPWGWNTGK